jgi:hypothetical protein
MPRPLNRRQARENARFLAALARTGNARLAAHVLGVHRSTYTKRRAKHPAFAAAWDAALAEAARRLEAADARAPGTVRGGSVPAGPAAGDPVIVRLACGGLQLRRASGRQIGAAAEQAYCRALSASANKRWSAAQAGFAHSSFHRRALRDPRFAAMAERCLAIGWDRVLAALYQALDRMQGPWSPEDEADWEARVADCPLPPMTYEDAYNLLRFHEEAMRNAGSGG